MLLRTAPKVGWISQSDQGPRADTTEPSRGPDVNVFDVFDIPFLGFLPKAGRMENIGPAGDQSKTSKNVTSGPRAAPLFSG